MPTPLMSKRRRQRLTIHQEKGSTLISLGAMDIWDGADLALIRDTLFEQIFDYNLRNFILDMQTVKYVPSGFFGMLGEWKDRGVQITIKGVQPNVSGMLWFRQFFTELRPGYFGLESEPKFSVDAVLRDDEDDRLESEAPSPTEVGAEACQQTPESLPC
ncbi:MAG: hypothetical protein HUJ26_02335 [Planctomycetaceae bacterium]|nr:hypothetical protein [Planctomycetaceae bacterium]